MNTPSNPDSYRDKNLQFKIFLIGYMASGKTHFGKKLAAALDFDFMDMDESMEAREKLTVAEIFDQKGEAYFRHLEKEILEQTTHLKNTIIATGGGTPCFFNNMDFILQNGYSIWLDTPIAILQKRIATANGKRPLLKDLQADTLTHKIRVQLQERMPFYSKANLHWQTNTGTEADCIALLKEKFSSNS